MRFRLLCLLAAILATMGASTLCGQDTRRVAEPRIPAACVTLRAEIAAPGGVIAPTDEHHLDTGRIQSAMDHCATGKAVVLRANGQMEVFLTGPLALRSGVTLVIDKNTALVASRDPRIYDLTPGSCGIVSERGHGCKPLVAGDGVVNSGIMGDGSIDGRGGATLLGQKVTWWDLAHAAKVTDRHQSVPWMIVLRHAKDFTLYRITLRNSPMFHVAVNESDGFTAWGVRIMAPRTARNTDGIDPSSSRNITITHCWIRTGDDNVAVKAGKEGPSSDISVVHNHFYTGHGMSIGSGTTGGVDHMLVDDLTIDGADNGIRIKSDRSRGGLVHDILYRDICMRNVRNPLLFTPLYTTLGGDQVPVYRGITLEDVHILTPGTYTLQGLDAEHRLELDLDNVFADGLRQSKFYDKYATITIGPRRGNLAPAGEAVTTKVAKNAVPGQSLACSARFLPFPALPSAPEIAGEIPPEDHALYVAADGTGKFTSIQDAAATTGARSRVRRNR